MPKITISIETDSADEAKSVIELVGSIPPSREQIESQIKEAKTVTRGRKPKAEVVAPIDPPETFTAPGKVEGAVVFQTASPAVSADPAPIISGPLASPSASAQIPNFQDAFAQPLFGAAPVATSGPVQDPTTEIAACRAALINLGQKVGNMDKITEWAVKGLGMPAGTTTADFLGNGPGEGLILGVPTQALVQLTDVAKQS